MSSPVGTMTRRSERVSHIGCSLAHVARACRAQPIGWGGDDLMLAFLSFHHSKSPIDLVGTSWVPRRTTCKLPEPCCRVCGKFPWRDPGGLVNIGKALSQGGPCHGTNAQDFTRRVHQANAAGDGGDARSSR